MVWVAAVLFSACDPKVDQVTPAVVITAQFDPSAAVPVVPTPNDLATNPKTGLLAITAPPGASAADKEFYKYLDGLNGYPTSATAEAMFDGPLDPASVMSAGAVHVYDVTAGYTKVTTTPVYSDTTIGADMMPMTGGAVSVPPPSGGWIPGHSYAVGLVGGASGLKGSMSTGSRQVVGSATWALLRSTKPLVTCQDLTSPSCQSVTNIIPSAQKEDPAARLADQAKSAIQLEQLRLKYKPVIDTLIGDGAKREDIVLAWTFQVTDFTSVVFDPTAMPAPLVPTPNDLAIDRMTGLVKVPIDPSYSDAYKEFITDYLDTLDGFPVSAVAQVAVSGDLDPTTVNNDTVVVLPLDGKAVDPATVSWSAATKRIVVQPPNASWGKGRHIAIAVIGRKASDVGDSSAPPAVQGVGGGPIVASAVWALARSASPLVDCPNGDLTSPECKLAVTAAPLTVGQAVQLEQLRQLYAPALDALDAKGISREDVAILWTFGTVSLPEATFDPTTSVIPFPNNLLRTSGTNPHLALPVPDGGSPLQQGLVAGLNTLDGFSLTAPVVSESSDTLGALDIGMLDPNLLDAGTGFVKVLGPGPSPVVQACLNCASSTLPDAGAPNSPQQLQFVPRIPLQEQATYAAYLTTDLKDLGGHRVIASPTFALARLKNPLCDLDAGMKSTVPVLSDLQACGAGGQPGLEQLRQGTEVLFDGFADAGVPRKKLALGWAFSTETTVTQLQQLHDAVAAVMPPTTVTLAPIPLGAAVPAQLPQSHLNADLFIGTLTLPFAETGPGGVILPPNNWTTQKAAYMLTVPGGTPPANGWPVVIFGHGLSSNRTTMVAIADSLAAAGFATVAIDVIWHGERTTCTGSAAVLKGALMNSSATDDYACTSPGGTTPDPVNAMCSPTGRCVKRGGMGTACVSDVQCMTTGQGYCQSGFCEGADLWRNASKQPQINAWNFLNLGNLFAARDNFRHYAIDLAQLVRVVKADAFFNANPNTAACAVAAPPATCAPHLDSTNLNYVGMSLGGFNGTLFAAVDPDVKNVMLNVPGSDQTLALLISPAFAQVRDAFLGQLAPLGLTPGTPQFDQLTTLLRTIFDRADPQNFGFTAVNRVNPLNRKVFIQSIQDDFVVPNVTTDKLIAAATSGAKMPALERINPPFSALMPADRHGFLLNFKDIPTTAAAQTKAATFVLTGAP
jgi:pimeloyl-ACP methyl ester carboxylesterase